MTVCKLKVPKIESFDEYYNVSYLKIVNSKIVTHHQLIYFQKRCNPSTTEQIINLSSKADLIIHYPFGQLNFPKEGWNPSLSSISILI